MTVHTAGRPDSINRNIISSLVLPKYLFNFLYQVSGKNNKVVFTAYMDAALFFVSISSKYKICFYASKTCRMFVCDESERN